jgi:hypothetical protein
MVQRHPHLEGLEGRVVLSTIGVNTKVATVPAIVASLMDTHSATVSNPAADTLSNVIKKSSDTENTNVQNLK